MPMQKKQIRNRILYLDFLRILATAAVMILHTASKVWYASDIGSFNWNASNVWDSIVRWCVPVFAMISGTLFLNPDNEIRIKNLYTRNICRVLTAFIFWSFLYAFNPFSDKIFTPDKLLSGHYHLWFLFMIVGFYITVPLLREITRTERTTKYFLVASFVLNISANTFFHILLPCFPSINASPFISALSKDYNNANIDFLLGYSFYFVLGYYLSRHTFRKKTNYFVYMLAVAACFATILFTYMASIDKNTSWTGWYNYLSVNVALQSMGMFVLIKNAKLKWIQKQQKLISTISKYTFGMYLVHIFLLELLIKELKPLSYNAVITIPAISIFVFLSSLVLSCLLNNIPIVKRYIV